MENNGNDIFDPIETDNSQNNGGYVPRFERDLQKMGGNLNALADAKKAEQQAENAEPVQDDPYENEELEDEVIAEEYDEKEEVSFSTSPYHTAVVQYESYENDDNYCRGKTVEELIRENEEQDRLNAVKADKAAAEEAYRNLEDVKISADMLGDMGYNYKQQERNEKRKKQELDDLALEIGSKPKLEEMSDIYQPSSPLQKKSTFDSQEALGRDEKQHIKERLQKEIDSRPKGINKKNSAELYKVLMHEQKVKRAKKGMLSLIIMAICGIAASFIVYLRLNPDKLNIITYAAIGGVAFSILMLLKAKFFRTLSCLVFSAETVYMVYTCVNFALNTEIKPDNYFGTLICFIVVIAVFSIIAIQLATNANIESYYTTSFSKKKAPSVSANSGTHKQRTVQRKK